MNKKTIMPLFLIGAVFLMGCTSISDLQETKARLYCQDTFQSLCSLENKTCISEGLGACKNAEFVFKVVAANETRTVQCFESVCLYR